MNYYYEVADACVNEMGGKYFVVYDKSGDSMMAGGVKLTQVSERIWKESPTYVSFLKNRFSRNWPVDPVDAEEFFMIKLKCKPVAEVLR